MNYLLTLNVGSLILNWDLIFDIECRGLIFFFNTFSYFMAFIFVFAGAKSALVPCEYCAKILADPSSCKALAKRSHKLTQVENLGLLATPFGQALRALALTCDDLRSLWSRSNLHASQSKFFTVWPLNPSQRKLSDVH